MSMLFLSLLELIEARQGKEREMLDNPPPPQAQAPAASMLPQSTDSGAVVKRYAPPNQRNRSSNRRKSSDRLDRTNSVGSDLEKNQIAFSRIPDQGNAVGYNVLNENHYSRFIALEGCSCSAASQLHSDRWSAAMQAYNNPKDFPEKPIMCSGGTSSVWTQFRLPHQIMSPAGGASSSVSQLDFLGELRRQMQSANPSFST